MVRSGFRNKIGLKFIFIIMILCFLHPVFLVNAEVYDYIDVQYNQAHDHGVITDFANMKSSSSAVATFVAELTIPFPTLTFGMDLTARFSNVNPSGLPYDRIYLEIYVTGVSGGPAIAIKGEAGDTTPDNSLGSITSPGLRLFLITSYVQTNQDFYVRFQGSKVGSLFTFSVQYMRLVFYDDTNPWIQRDGWPQQSVYYSEDPELSFTMRDSVELDNWRYYIDSSLQQTISISGQSHAYVNWQISEWNSLSEGFHDLDFIVNDAEGNTGTDQFLFYKDTTPPSIPNIASSTHTNGVWSTNNDPQFTFSGSTDSAPGSSTISGYSYQTNGLPDNIVDTSGPIGINNFADGDHFLYAAAVDDTIPAIISGSRMFNLRIDTTPPSAPSPNDGVSGWTSDNTPTFSWNTITDISGISGYYYAVDDPTPETGGTSTSGTSATLGTQTDGAHTFYIKARNGAGLYSSVSSHQFYIDATPAFEPTPDDGVSGWSTDNTPTFTWPNSTSESGIDGYWYAIDDPTPETGGIFSSQTFVTLPTQLDGTHTFYLKAENNVGLLSSAGSHTFFIDASTPTAPSPDDGITGWSSDDTPTFTWNLLNDTSGIEGFYYVIDNIAPESEWTFTNNTFATLNPQLEGLHTFYIKAMNGAMLNSTLGEHNFSIDTSPSIAPVPDDNISGWSVNNAPTFNWTQIDDISGISGYWYAVDDPSPESGGAFTALTQVTLPIQVDGNHTFYIKAENEAGLLSDVATHEFLIDSSAPTAPVTDDGVEGWSDDNTPTFTWTQDEDHSGIVGYWYSVDSPDPEISGTWTTEISVTLSVQTDGNHTFFIKSVNGVGIFSLVAIHEFAIDTTIPTSTSDPSSEPETTADITSDDDDTTTISSSVSPTEISSLGIFVACLSIAMIKRKKR